MGNQLKDALAKIGIKPAAKAVTGRLEKSAERKHPFPRTSGRSRSNSIQGGNQLWPEGASHPRHVPRPVELQPQLVVGEKSKKKVGGDLSSGQGMKPEPVVTVTGDITPHFLLQDGLVTESRRILIVNDGIQKQIADVPENFADLILGLDFGTSSVKAVIRDHLANLAFPVVFTEDPGNPYLLPSRVWRNGNSYSLDDGGSPLRNLKLSLLDSHDEEPVDELNDAIAFISLVIRHCRGWFFDAYAPRYRKHAMTWRVNLGLPARSYEDISKVRLFHRLVWAASNCASDPAKEITNELVDHYRNLSKDAFSGVESFDGIDCEFSIKDVDVVPEIAAQVFGFVESAKWDWQENPMMLMVDIGAGTVDAAFFSVVRNNEKQLRFSFFSNEVQPNGVMNLHRFRVQWLKDILSRQLLEYPALAELFARIEKPTDRIRPIPDSIMDYVQGLRIELPKGQPSGDDIFFHTRYRRQVFGCIKVARSRGIPDTQLIHLPFFLCGGGSRMPIFHGILKLVNDAPVNVTVASKKLPKPDEIVSEGLIESEFDRLSVAYGLSRQGAGGKPLGEYIRSLDIPDVLRPRCVDYSDLYIEQP